MTYLLHILVAVCTQMAVVAVTHLLQRSAGLSSVGQAAVCGVGGYVALAAVHILGLPWLLALCLGVLAAALSSVVLLPCLLREAQYFVLLTLVGQLLFSSIVRVLAVTGGESGLRPIGGLPRGIPGGEGWRALVAIGLSVLAVLAVATLRGSRLERSARAIADSAELALGLGLSPWVVRFKLLTICSGLVGLMGAAMALYRQGVSPDDFALGRSILVVGIASLVANGGTTRVLVVAAAVLTSAEALQLMMPATPVAQVAFGLLLVGAAAWRRS